MVSFFFSFVIGVFGFLLYRDTGPFSGRSMLYTLMIIVLSILVVLLELEERGIL